MSCLASVRFCHTPTASAMDLCDCGQTDSCGLVKAGHWEIGGGYRATVVRARAIVMQSNAGERIEQLVYMLRYSNEPIDDPALAVRSFMGLSGGSERMERALRILFADVWVAREAHGLHAAWPIVYRARRVWQRMGLSGNDYSKWMQAIWKACLFYWAAGEEGYCCIADACGFSI